MTLTPAQLDRAVGALLGTAAGDALGAPYEFGPPRGPDLDVAMTGGGPWEPGEWTDDTSMAIAIAEVASGERWNREPFRHAGQAADPLTPPASQLKV
jgi:ADP-ribosylglycohydrolase